MGFKKPNECMEVGFLRNEWKGYNDFLKIRKFEENICNACNIRIVGMCAPNE
jgi:hypothetical protein